MLAPRALCCLESGNGDRFFSQIAFRGARNALTIDRGYVDLTGIHLSFRREAKFGPC